MNNIIDYDKIGQRIRTARKKQGFKQEKICNALNISLYHYSKIENGKVSASLEILAEIANYLNIEMDYLLTGSSKVDKQYLNEEISNILNKCDENQKKMILEFAKYISKSEIKSVPTNFN